MTTRRTLFLSAALLALAAPAARAQVGEMRMRPSRDMAITVAAGTSWLTMELFRGSFLPSSCRWCDRGPDGGDGLNAFDRRLRNALVWEDTRAAGLASNVALYGGTMAATLGLGALTAFSDGRGANLGDDAMIVAQSTFIALTVNDVAKIAFRRQRPFAHAASLTPEGILHARSSDNLSFFSGHTTLAFSLAVSAGTVASMRGYRLAPLIWGVGLGSAAATGYLRVAADKHYVSDVLVGAAVGSLFGFAVPYFLHGSRSGEAATGLTGAPTREGGIISFSGTF